MHWVLLVSVHPWINLMQIEEESMATYHHHYQPHSFSGKRGFHGVKRCRFIAFIKFTRRCGLWRATSPGCGWWWWRGDIRWRAWVLSLWGYTWKQQDARRVKRFNSKDERSRFYDSAESLSAVYVFQSPQWVVVVVKRGIVSSNADYGWWWLDWLNLWRESITNWFDNSHALHWLTFLWIKLHLKHGNYF